MSRREAVIAVIDEVLVVIAIAVIIAYALYSTGIIDVLEALALALASAAIVAAFAYKLVEAQRMRVAAGAEALIGAVGEVMDDLDPEGHVIVEGEIWRARSIRGERIPRGSRVRIVAYNGLLLLVEKADERHVSLQRG